MAKEYKFTAAELESQISHLSERGITELSINDLSLSKDKKRLLSLINKISKEAPDLFVSILIDASVIDKEIVTAASQVFLSFDIPLEATSKGGKILFDKKFYSNKAKLLNDYGLVFGFLLTYAIVEGDSQKNFMDRLDFALQLYPNHIDFPQTEKDSDTPEARVTGIFSAQEIRYCRDLAFSCRTFYTSGRAVPWFLSALKPLRIYPSRFFADFAEWQRCNNCDFKSGFIPEKENHKDIEKMQLLFLTEKYEEKKQHSLIPLVEDVVKINGAMSRLAGENQESTVKTSYHPDDLFSQEIYDFEAFNENVVMEECNVKIFAGEEGPDYQVLSNQK